MDSFTILQAKLSSQSVLFDLCPTMDLCAVGSASSIAVFRTMSWEKLLSKDATELFSNNSALSAVAFSCSGKALAIANNLGEMRIIDMESAQCFLCVVGRSGYGCVTLLRWQGEGDAKQHLPHSPILSTMQEPGTDSKGKPADEFLLSGNDDSLLLSVLSNGQIRAHKFGIFPLFTVCVPLASGIISNPHYLVDGLLIVSVPYKVQRIVFQSEAVRGIHYASGALCRYFQLMQQDVALMSDVVLTQQKKWREATKPLAAKWKLFSDLLCGYQLDIGPLDYLYLMVTCGSWHPAAETHFGQYWNEQGINRLKSSIETCCDSIIWNLNMRVLPLSLNFVANCRDLIELLQGIHKRLNSFDKSRTTVLDHLISQSQCLLQVIQQLVFKMDQTLSEARLAREGMLRYLMFVRETMLMSLPDSAGTFNCKIDYSQRGLYAQLFDPRRPRASCTAHLAEPEYITGTFLYAYLQDVPLPSGLLREDSYERSIAERMMKCAHQSTIEGEVRVPTSCDFSLLSCIKDVNRQLKSLTELLHDVISSDADHQSTGNVVLRTVPSSGYRILSSHEIFAKFIQATIDLDANPPLIVENATVIAQVIVDQVGHQSGNPHAGAKIVIMIRGTGENNRRLEILSQATTDNIWTSDSDTCILRLAYNQQNVLESTSYSLEAIVAWSDTSSTMLHTFDLKSLIYKEHSFAEAIDPIETLRDNVGINHTVHVKSRRLTALNRADNLYVSGSRGVAIIAEDKTGSFVVVDIRNDEQIEGDED